MAGVCGAPGWVPSHLTALLQKTSSSWRSALSDPASWLTEASTHLRAWFTNKHAMTRQSTLARTGAFLKNWKTSAWSWITQSDRPGKKPLNWQGQIQHGGAQCWAVMRSALLQLVHRLTALWHSIRQSEALSPWGWQLKRRLSLGLWQPRHWVSAMQQSGLRKLLGSWKGRLRPVAGLEPQRAGQVQLVAYKPGAGHLSAWWTQHHK